MTSADGVSQAHVRDIVQPIGGTRGGLEGGTKGKARVFLLLQLS